MSADPALDADDAAEAPQGIDQGLGDPSAVSPPSATKDTDPREQSPTGDQNPPIERAATVEDHTRPLHNDSIADQTESERNDNTLDVARKDLRQQERMAGATDKMATYALVSTIFTGVGLILLAFTLCYTKRAARYTGVAAIQSRRAANYAKTMLVHTRDGTAAAVKAADAAAAANDIITKEYKTSFKPWITVSLIGPFVEEYPHVPDGQDIKMVRCFADLRIKNVGSMPATIEDVYAHLMPDEQKWPYIPPPGRSPGSTTETYYVILKDEELMINPKTGRPKDPRLSREPFSAFQLTREHERRFGIDPPPVVGFVVYSDPLGNRYKHNFGFVAPDPTGDRFDRYGGRAQNYERAIDE